MIDQTDSVTPTPDATFAVTVTEATRALIAQVAVWALEGKRSDASIAAVESLAVATTEALPVCL